MSFSLKVYCLLGSFFFCCFYSNSYGQKEANIWYFGNRIGLDFNHSPPKVLTDGQISFDPISVDGESSASISDIDGNLLFYTDGVSVWNKAHQVMPNGFGLFGNNKPLRPL